jgi:4-hydroxy-tetrahydrodipicolinate reductase
MIRIILSGCNGKMGQVVTRICANDPSVKIVAGCDLYDKQLSDYPVYKSFDLIKEEGDVAVDFSNPNVWKVFWHIARVRKYLLLSQQQV